MGEGVVERYLVFGLQGKWVLVCVIKREVKQGDGRLCGFTAQCLPHSMIRNHMVFLQCYSGDSVADAVEKILPFSLKALRQDHLKEGFECIVVLPSTLRFAAKVVYIIILHLVEGSPIHDASGYAAHGTEDASTTKHKETGVCKKVLPVGHQGYL